MRYKILPESETAWRTVEDAATHFQVSKATVYSWIKKDKIRTSVSLRGAAYIVDINSLKK